MFTLEGRGPVTESIQQTFFAATSGREERYREWLRHVVPHEVGIMR